MTRVDDGSAAARAVDDDARADDGGPADEAGVVDGAGVDDVTAAIAAVGCEARAALDDAAAGGRAALGVPRVAGRDAGCDAAAGGRAALDRADDLSAGVADDGLRETFADADDAPLLARVSTRRVVARGVCAARARAAAMAALADSMSPPAVRRECVGWKGLLLLAMLAVGRVCVALRGGASLAAADLVTAGEVVVGRVTAVRVLVAVAVAVAVAVVAGADAAGVARSLVPSDVPVDALGASGPGGGGSTRMKSSGMGGGSGIASDMDAETLGRR